MKRVELKNTSGHLNDVTFDLTGPPEQVDSIVRFIRSLTRFMNDVQVYNK